VPFPIRYSIQHKAYTIQPMAYMKKIGHKKSHSHHGSRT
jgi:hypothetical protein